MKFFFIILWALFFSFDCFSQEENYILLDSISLEDIFEKNHLNFDKKKGFGIPEISYRFDRCGRFLWLYDGGQILKYDLENKRKVTSVNVYSDVKNEFIRVVVGDSALAVLNVISITQENRLLSKHQFNFYDFELNPLPKKTITFSYMHYLEMPWDCSAYNFEYFFETDSLITFVTAGNRTFDVDKKNMNFLTWGLKSKYSYNEKKHFSYELNNEAFFILFENKKYTFADKNRANRLGCLLDTNTYMICYEEEKPVFKFIDLHSGNEKFKISLSNFILPLGFWYGEALLSYVKSESKRYFYNNRPLKRKLHSKNYIYFFKMKDY